MLEELLAPRNLRLDEGNERSIVNSGRRRIWPASHLCTTRGKTLEIVFHVRWTPGPGPDFRDAVIVFQDGMPSTGDVEILVLASNWYKHGHHTDPAYNNVVLHVVRRDDLSGPATRANGRPVETLELEVAGPETLDYSISDMPDCHLIAAGLPAGDLRPTLEEMGDEWFLAKAGRLQSDMSVLGPETTLLIALFDALGYSKNRKPLRRIANLLSAAQLERWSGSGPSTMEGLLLGLAGLLPSQRQVDSRDGQSDEYISEMESVWQMAAGPECQSTLTADDWVFSVRPANSPLRRLGAAARLVASGFEGLIDGWLRALAIEPVDLPAVLSSLTSNDSDSYWAWHSDFGRPLPNGPAALIGRGRAIETVANVSLPFVHALASMSGEPVVASNAMAAFGRLAAPSWNFATRSALELIGRRDLADLASGARRRQGLQWLYRNYCEQGRLLVCSLLELRQHPRSLDG